MKLYNVELLHCEIYEGDNKHTRKQDLMVLKDKIDEIINYLNSVKEKTKTHNLKGGNKKKSHTKK